MYAWACQNTQSYKNSGQFDHVKTILEINKPVKTELYLNQRTSREDNKKKEATKGRKEQRKRGKEEEKKEGRREGYKGSCLLMYQNQINSFPQ